MVKKMKSKSVSRRGREVMTQENAMQLARDVAHERATRARVILEYIVKEQFSAGKNTLGGALQRVCDMLTHEFRRGKRDAQSGVTDGFDDIPF